MLGQRLIFGTSLAGFVVGLVFLDGYLSTLAAPDWRLPFADVNLGPFLINGAACALVIALFTWLAAGELLAAVRSRGHEPFERVARLFAVGLVVGPFVAINIQSQTGWFDRSWEALWIALATAACFVGQGLRRQTRGALGNIAATLFIVVYTGLFAGFLVKLRLEIGGPAGVALLALTVLAVKMSDTGAYFVGRVCGRRKLIEWLSPKKTWEGFIGGLVVAVVATTGAGLALERWELVPPSAGLLRGALIYAGFGLLMGLVSVVGDLCASLLKRDADLKDSGRGLPGMGGVLDIFDSPLFAAPFAWFFWSRAIGMSAIG